MRRKTKQLPASGVFVCLWVLQKPIISTTDCVMHQDSFRWAITFKWRQMFNDVRPMFVLHSLLLDAPTWLHDAAQMLENAVCGHQQVVVDKVVVAPLAWFMVCMGKKIKKRKRWGSMRGTAKQIQGEESTKGRYGWSASWNCQPPFKPAQAARSAATKQGGYGCQCRVKFSRFLRLNRHTAL